MKFKPICTNLSRGKGSGYNCGLSDRSRTYEHNNCRVLDRDHALNVMRTYVYVTGCAWSAAIVVYEVRGKPNAS